VYREYLYADRTISEHARAIIELSKNKQVKYDRILENRSGLWFDRVKEDMCGEVYRKTVFDSRCFQKPDVSTGMTISQLYGMCGVVLHPASGRKLEDTVPIVKEWLRVSEDREHHVTKKMGAPRLYVFSTCKNLCNHIEHYINQERNSDGTNPSEKPRSVDDHDMDALRYLVQIPPIFVDGCGIGTYQREEEEDVEYLDGKKRRKREAKTKDTITGY